MLQQVYNTARVQQEVQQEYSKSTARGTASLYDTVILLILFINKQYMKTDEMIFIYAIFFSFMQKIKNIMINRPSGYVAVMGLPASSPGCALHPGGFL
jgi:hypothetical protein